jgi:hypothetical protein
VTPALRELVELLARAAYEEMTATRRPETEPPVEVESRPEFTAVRTTD